MLLEKLQIAFMIRSSIRTCRTCFAAWSNETVKISKTVVTPIRPVTPNLAPMLFEPSETDQRSFEILNIALVERIFWCSSNKSLVRKSLKHWAKVSRESGMMRMKARYRVIKFAFFSWVQKVASRVSRLILKCISSTFTVWKCFACRKSALKSTWFAVKAKDIAAQKKARSFYVAQAHIWHHASTQKHIGTWLHCASYLENGVFCFSSLASMDAVNGYP